MSSLPIYSGKEGKASRAPVQFLSLSPSIVVSTPVFNLIITLSLPGKSTNVHCSPPLAIIVIFTNQRPHHNLFYSTSKVFENTYPPLTFSTFKYKYNIIIRILNIYQIFSIKYDIPPPPGKSLRPHVHCSLSQDTSHKILPPRYGSYVTMIFFETKVRFCWEL